MKASWWMALRRKLQPATFRMGGNDRDHQPEALDLNLIPVMHHL